MKFVVALRMLTQNVTIAAKDSAEGLRIVHQTRTASNPEISLSWSEAAEMPFTNPDLQSQFMGRSAKTLHIRIIEEPMGFF